MTTSLRPFFKQPLRAQARAAVAAVLRPLPAHWREYISHAIHRALPNERNALAAQHLQGAGIEIGAMHFPVRMPPGARVRYVDYLSREDNLKRFPELKHFRLVTPEFVEDGCRLPSFSHQSVDFVVANHVLEHTPNAFGVLERWSQVLRMGGTLLISVPLAADCFDRHRSITLADHFLSDHLLAQQSDDALWRANRAHYQEWVDRVLDVPADADLLAQERADIHFHTFDADSFCAMLGMFCEQVSPDMALLDVRSGRGETVALLRKTGEVHHSPRG